MYVTNIVLGVFKDTCPIVPNIVHLLESNFVSDFYKPTRPTQPARTTWPTQPTHTRGNQKPELMFMFFLFDSRS